MIRSRNEFYNNFQHGRCIHLKRAFPQYCVNGESALLCFKPIMPEFKPAGKEGIALQNAGRMLLAFTRNSPGRGFLWTEQIYFSLSVEEIGLLIAHIPHQPLKISRNLNVDSNDEGGVKDRKYDSISTTNDIGRKVLSIVPEEYAIKFSIDYVDDSLDASSQITREAMEVAMQAGEWEVVKSTLKESIPYFLGWNHMMDIATSSAINEVGTKN